MPEVTSAYQQRIKDKIARARELSVEITPAAEKVLVERLESFLREPPAAAGDDTPRIYEAADALVDAVPVLLLRLYNDLGAKPISEDAMSEFIARNAPWICPFPC